MYNNIYADENAGELEELKEYFFDRDTFTNTFFSICEKWYDEILSKCEVITSTDDFILEWREETYTFVHKPSGTVISFYKHVGRCNTCNKPYFSVNDLRRFWELLLIDLDYIER